MNHTIGTGETPQLKTAVDRRTIERAIREARTMAELVSALVHAGLSIDSLTDMERGVVICRYIAAEAKNDAAEVMGTMSTEAEDAFLRHMGAGDLLAAGAVFLQSAGQAPYTSDVLSAAESDALLQQLGGKTYTYNDYLADEADRRITELREAP